MTALIKGDWDEITFLFLKYFCQMIEFLYMCEGKNISNKISENQTQSN